MQGCTHFFLFPAGQASPPEQSYLQEVPSTPPVEGPVAVAL